MGILPLQFLDGQSATSLGLTGREVMTISGLDALNDGQAPAVVNVTADDRTFAMKVRLDTARDADYYRHGGITPYVIRKILHRHRPGTRNDRRAPDSPRPECLGVTMPALSRRSFLGASSAAAVSSLVGAPPAMALRNQGEVPFSVGTNRPDFAVPHWAVDTHMHIFEPERFPYPNPTATPPPRATVSDYRLLQKRLGTTKTVVVTPSNYATDNRCTLDAIAKLDQRYARGVAVIDDTFSGSQIQELHDGGIRGIRFNLTRPGGAGAELIRPWQHASPTWAGMSRST